ncbi:MAG: DUF3035 domain-containing protein [Pseudomonadota bacterium]
MQGKALNAVWAGVACLTLVACGNGGGLRDFRSPSAGPDEFSVTPSLPLEAPPSLTTLPEPTLGGQNRADATPQSDAVVALGGRVVGGRVVSGGVPAADGAIVSYASRRGVDPSIRADLAAADRAFRERRVRLGSVFSRRTSRYYSAYAGQSLDAYAELERFRAAGVRVPSAPPR